MMLIFDTGITFTISKKLIFAYKKRVATKGYPSFNSN